MRLKWRLWCYIWDLLCFGARLIDSRSKGQENASLRNIIVALDYLNSQPPQHKSEFRALIPCSFFFFLHRKWCQVCNCIYRLIILFKTSRMQWTKSYLSKLMVVHECFNTPRDFSFNKCMTSGVSLFLLSHNDYLSVTLVTLCSLPMKLEWRMLTGNIKGKVSFKIR